MFSDIFAFSTSKGTRHLCCNLIDLTFDSWMLKQPIMSESQHFGKKIWHLYLQTYQERNRSRDDFLGDCRLYTQSQKKRTMNSVASPVTQGQGQVTPAGSFWSLKLPHIARKPWTILIWFFFAHCYQQHQQNEIYYEVHLSTLFPKRYATFLGAFLSRLSVE